ncbi:hypothetical protein BIFANG_02111 [Bifidobacterium angulatum DSM 20098 = JCM 7096]|uniref:Uncharacterized protein n=1 Tax=Bifidobacterium angulatum DSM 20098 = JCM 7096 TaxID=518635 RepID=C4FCT4_9BIFI|nr:hypothetical protein BIFANG_02111 [Bifidobacterium angulatum DSM 20098 = JCM 7096]
MLLAPASAIVEVGEAGVEEAAMQLVMVFDNGVAMGTVMLPDNTGQSGTLVRSRARSIAACRQAMPCAMSLPPASSSAVATRR